MDQKLEGDAWLSGCHVRTFSSVGLLSNWEGDGEDAVWGVILPLWGMFWLFLS